MAASRGLKAGFHLEIFFQRKVLVVEGRVSGNTEVHCLGCSWVLVFEAVLKVFRSKSVHCEITRSF